MILEQIELGCVYGYSDNRCNINVNAGLSGYMCR